MNILTAFFQSAILFLFQITEYLLNRSRNDAQFCFVLQESINVAVESHSTERVLARMSIVVPMLSKHRVSFARAGLTVCEDGGVESTRDIKDAI